MLCGIRIICILCYHREWDRDKSSHGERDLLCFRKNCPVSGAVWELNECLMREWDLPHQEYSSWGSGCRERTRALVEVRYNRKESVTCGWHRASVCSFNGSPTILSLLITSIPLCMSWIGKTNRVSASLTCAIANDVNALSEVRLAGENHPSFPVKAKKKKKRKEKKRKTTSWPILKFPSAPENLRSASGKAGVASVGSHWLETLCRGVGKKELASEGRSGLATCKFSGGQRGKWVGKETNQGRDWRWSLVPWKIQEANFWK